MQFQEKRFNMKMIIFSCWNEKQLQMNQVCYDETNQDTSYDIFLVTYMKYHYKISKPTNFSLEFEVLH